MGATSRVTLGWMRRALLIDIAAVLAVGGCGGGGNDNGTTTTAAITKAQLVQRATAICRQTIQKDHQALESL